MNEYANIWMDSGWMKIINIIVLAYMFRPRRLTHCASCKSPCSSSIDPSWTLLESQNRTVQLEYLR